MPTARCPRCGVVPWRVHGRYARRLADAPVGGAPVVVELMVRWFKCLNPQRPAVTSAEQIEGLTSPQTPGTCCATSPKLWRSRSAPITGASARRS
ncbi:transposase family protein [Streptomyces sp. AGS-58]|uniref:transposase family protein n=1 Tax=unclassified Streptomyces TaxID=2593676 RepID=UPI0035A3256B